MRTRRTSAIAEAEVGASDLKEAEEEAVPGEGTGRTTEEDEEHDDDNNDNDDATGEVDKGIG